MSLGLSIVKRSEGFREYAYPDPASNLARTVRCMGLKPRWGFVPAATLLATLPEEVRNLSGAPWTCGYGETLGVTMHTRWSEPEALAKLRNRYAEFEASVLQACTVTPSTEQLAAMTSLTYNIGVAGFKRSTVLKAHNRGDFLAASRAFNLWNRANNRVEPGLTARRAEEAALYMRGVAAPQSFVSSAVDPESKMTESPINRASVVAGGTAAVATVAETARTVADVKTSADYLQEWLVPVLLLVIVALCGYVIFTRYKQRREGWA